MPQRGNVHIVMLAGDITPLGRMAATIYHLTANWPRRSGSPSPARSSAAHLRRSHHRRALAESTIAFTRSFGRNALRALLQLCQKGRRRSRPPPRMDVGGLTRATRSRQPYDPASGSVSAKGSLGTAAARAGSDCEPERSAILLTAKAYARTSRAEEHLFISAFSRQEFIDAYRPPEGGRGHPVGHRYGNVPSRRANRGNPRAVPPFRCLKGTACSLPSAAWPRGG